MTFFRFLVVLTLFAFSLLAAGRPARAMDMYAYDLDSLVYLSTDIVDAEPVSVPSEKGTGITTVKVTHVYLGHFHVGDTVQVTALGFFRIEQPDKNGVLMGEGGRHLGVGDHLTLFLAKAHSVFLYDVPPGDTYWPAPSGVKMLDEGRIKGFEQYSNPGPYELQWTDQSVANRFPVLNSLPTPAEFYRQIEASISKLKPALAWSSRCAHF